MQTIVALARRGFTRRFIFKYEAIEIGTQVAQRIINLQHSLPGGQKHHQPSTRPPRWPNASSTFNTALRADDDRKRTEGSNCEWVPVAATNPVRFYL
jgi:hypothetical protein